MLPSAGRAADMAAHFGMDSLYLIRVHKNLDRPLFRLIFEPSIAEMNRERPDEPLGTALKRGARCENQFPNQII